MKPAATIESIPVKTVSHVAADNDRFFSDFHLELDRDRHCGGGLSSFLKTKEIPAHLADVREEKRSMKRGQMGCLHKLLTRK